MERTLYTDGVEVDASDLTNTEDTKVEEILLTRQVTTRYGVIDGLGCSTSGNRITVDTGRLLFRNGEVAVLTSPIINIVGASFEGGVSTFVGLRLGEVTSNPKPHEVDPTIFDTRATPKITAELFVASDPSTAARARALQAAIDAELNDANFVLLSEFAGVGNGLTRVTVTPQPRSKGGDDPFRSPSKTKNQKTALVSIYLDNTNDQFPVASAEDHFHRSLIGSGIPNPQNAHGTTLTDIGGDAILDQAITKHQREFHANGIIGLESLEDEFAETNFSSGSFAWGIDQTSSAVTVHDLLNVDDGVPQDEVLVIQGKELKKGQSNTIPDGDKAPRISFASITVPGLYYIFARWGSNEAGGMPVFDKMFKDDFDLLCVDSDGKKAWLNNAVDPTVVDVAIGPERKFYVIGLVQWNGSSAFTNLATNPMITIPGPSGDLLYKTGLPAGHPFQIPINKKVLDLRRFGSVTNETVQKRTIRLDRLTQVLVTEDDFIVHSGTRIVSGSPVMALVNSNNHATPGPDNSILKHLTDFDADRLFGHRPAIGTSEHGRSQHSGGLDGSFIPLDEEAVNSGFQSAADKWRQTFLTMTLMKWADLQTVQGAAGDTLAMGDAAAVSTRDALAGGAGSYIVYRRGELRNFGANVHHRPANLGPPHTLSISFVVFSISGAAPSTLVTNAQEWSTLTVDDQLPALGFVSDASIVSRSCTNIVDVLTIEATPAAPKLISCVRTKNSAADTGANVWKDLTVTAEFHYTS
jgi:hypothetical protein